MITCGHEFCSECLGTILDNALREKDTTGLRCPDPTCKKAIEQTDIAKITDDKDTIRRLGDIQLQEWVAQQRDAKHCPTPDCPCVFLNDEKAQRNITCRGCKKTYCSNCLLPHNAGTTCEQAKDAQRDPVGEAWKRQHTRQCPGCEAFIERIAGCRYMQCTHCKSYFCWECLTLLNKDHENHPCQPITNPVQAGIQAQHAAQPARQDEVQGRQAALRRQHAIAQQAVQEEAHRQRFNHPGGLIGIEAEEIYRRALAAQRAEERRQQAVERQRLHLAAHPAHPRAQAIAPQRIQPAQPAQLRPQQAAERPRQTAAQQAEIRQQRDIAQQRRMALHLAAHPAHPRNHHLARLQHERQVRL